MVRGGSRERWLGRLLVLALVPGLVLLARLGFDLGGLHVAMAVVVGLFYAALLATTVANSLGLALRAATAERPSLRARVALGLAVPVALLASGLDCMGVELDGCTPTCDALLHYMAPMVSLLVVVAALGGSVSWLLAGLLAAFGLLVPNCVCRNPVNRWWIDWLGQSPACFATSFAVILTSIAALASGRRVVASLVLAWTLVATMLAFWIGHHYYRFPW